MSYDWAKLFRGEITDKMLAAPGLYRIEVTPSLAERLYAKNVGNRRIRVTLVDYLAGQILRGEWQSEHPQPLVTSDAGRLIDGQHRLLAIIQTGKTVIVMLRTGVPDGVREYLDTGIVRTLDDRVAFVDDPKVNRHVSQIVATWWFIVLRNRQGGKPSPEQARQLFCEHEKSILAIQTRIKKDRSVGRVPIAIAACEYFELDAGKACEFYESLFIPDGSVQQAKMLRDWLLRNTASMGGGSCVSLDLYDRAVYCMNKHNHGERVSKVLAGAWSNGK